MPNKSLSRSGLLTYQKYSSLLAGNDPYEPALPYELIAAVDLASSQSTVTFDVTGLGVKYRHLEIRGVVKTTRASSLDDLQLIFNGDTAANYSSFTVQAGNPSALTASGVANTSHIGLGYLPGTSNATSWAACTLDIADAFETTKYKATKHRGAMTDGNWQLLTLNSGSWRSNSAITTITLRPGTGPDFAANTRFSIYGYQEI